MLNLDARGAAKELADFAGMAQNQLKDLDDQAKSTNFANKIGWASAASPALSAVLEQLASVRKSVFGVDAAMQIAQRSIGGFEDLANELATINQLFKDGAISADVAQKAFSKVADEGQKRQEDAARLAERNAKIEEAHWHKIDEQKRVAAREAAHEAAENERLLADRRRAGVGQFKSLAGWGIGLTTAAVGMSARSGFSDTLQGQQSQAYGYLLNRQVASIFAPMLEEKTRYVAQMTQWLQGLSEPQRESIRTMASFAISMGTLGVVVPKVLNGLRGLSGLEAATSMRELVTGRGKAIVGARGVMDMAALAGKPGGALAAGAAPNAALSATMASALNPVVTGLAVAAGLLSATPKGREALAELMSSLTPILDTLASAITSLTPAIATVAKSAAETLTWLRNRFPTPTPQQAQERRNWLEGIIGRDALDTLRDPFFLRDLGASPGSSNSLSGVPKGAESFEASWDRINDAAAKVGLDRQIDLLQEIANNTRNNNPPQLPIGNAIAGGLMGAIGF